MSRNFNITVIFVERLYYRCYIAWINDGVYNHPDIVIIEGGNWDDFCHEQIPQI